MENRENKYQLLRREKNDYKSKISNDEYTNYIFSGFNQDKSDDSVVVELDDNLIKNENGNFKSNKYRTRFTLDNAQAIYSFDSRFGSQGMAQFSFSDILGDHQVF